MQEFHKQEQLIKHKIFISKDILATIEQLHRGVGPIEWSGMLLYEEKGGSLEDGLDLQVKGVFPMDIGHSTYTDFNAGKKMQEIEKLYPTWEDEDWRLGLVH